MSRSEFFLYDHLFDEILILLENKKIEFNSAKTLLEIHADINLYNIMLEETSISEIMTKVVYFTIW